MARDLCFFSILGRPEGDRKIDRFFINCLMHFWSISDYLFNDFSMFFRSLFRYSFELFFNRFFDCVFDPREHEIIEKSSVFQDF